MPTVLTAAAKIRDLLAGWSFPNNPEGFDKITTLVDKNLEDFVKGVRTPKGLYNDPTYLGFNLMFDWYESPLFKGGLSANVDFERFSTESLQSEHITDGANFPAGSALNFFLKNGMKNRVYQLATCIQQLNYVNYNMPWYWQSITGLDTAVKKMENFRATPYRGGSDSIITINTLESMDFMIQGISDLYKRSVDDTKYRREILPDNLRKFDVYVFINDIRNFNLGAKGQISTGEGGAPATAAQPEPHDAIKENLPKLAIKLIGCKFVYHDNATIFETVSNIESTAATNTLSFKYDDLEVITDVPWFTYSINSNADEGLTVSDEKTFFQRIAAKLAEAAIEKAKAIGKRAVQSAIRLAIDAAKRLILANFKLPWNNVYGGSYGALSTIASGNVGAVAEGAYNKSGINNKYLNNAFGITNTNAPSAAGTPDVGDSLFQGQGSSNSLDNPSMQFPEDTPSYIPGTNSNINDAGSIGSPSYIAGRNSNLHKALLGSPSYIDLNLTNIYDE